MSFSSEIESHNLQPKQLWQYFAQICQIPHPSKKEQQLTKFMQEFGQGLGLETIVDEAGNIVIRKPATSGMEGHKGVILQAHLDMVPQKNTEVEHDFAKDPIEAYVDGEWVKARGTTLGADNGIGLAAIMTVLQAKNIKHGPIEALFTSDEETAMIGAKALKAGILQGDILLNLDSETDGEFFIGCAGGIDTIAKSTYTKEKVGATLAVTLISFKISVTGLKGGHSGGDIHLGRGNANKIMNRLLWGASEKYGLRIANIYGGGLRNAIPRESVAVVTVPPTEENNFMNFIKEFTDIIKNELSTADPELKIEAVKTEQPDSLIDKETQNKLLNAIYACPHGVLEMSKDIPDLVETSANLATVDIANGNIEIDTSQRSSIASAKQMASNMVSSLFSLIGADIENYGDYPGWQPDPNSSIVSVISKIYQEKYRKAPEIKAIHAGLECGLLKSKYPNLDMISFGPTILGAHSPDEKVNIATVTKFWDILVATLENI
jgi:dipeptidase D